MTPLEDGQSDSTPIYETHRGSMYCGQAETVLRSAQLIQFKGKVDLVFTSPPFPLARKKKYGNRQGETYVKWLADFAPVFREYVAPLGSIVLELGNAWEPGSPTMSTLPMKALLAFQEAAGLHLCQEFICFNPARLPTPAQWVTVDRVRVKDAFTRLWWLSPSPNPKANNRKVLSSYSESMRKLLERGTYNSGRRPSEHRIGRTSFLKKNPGAIPPNVLVPPLKEILPELFEVLPISNTKSNDAFQKACKDNGLGMHPARMSERLAEFFIRFLTDEDDLLLDPFAGSNTTGVVAQRLNRNWIAIDADTGYAVTSQRRFGMRLVP